MLNSQMGYYCLIIYLMERMKWIHEYLPHREAVPHQYECDV